MGIGLLWIKLNGGRGDPVVAAGTLGYAQMIGLLAVILGFWEVRWRIMPGLCLAVVLSIGSMLFATVGAWLIFTHLDLGHTSNEIVVSTWLGQAGSYATIFLAVVVSAIIALVRFVGARRGR
ncbi:MAG: hypothetical protein AAF830_01645 [Pseudomonadota bacterium]